MIGFQAEDVVGLRPLNLSRDGFLGAHGIKVTIQPLTSSNSSKAGMAVISFDLSCTLLCANTNRCSVAH